MELQEKIIELNIEINKYSKLIEEYQKQLNILKDCSQPSVIDLYNGIEKYYTCNVEYTSYKYILGGDGRSHPYSEIRRGLVATIKINEGIYFNLKQLNIIKEYIREKHNPEHIIFDK
jgi:hypothetical protein